MPEDHLVELDPLQEPIWSRCFIVAPLVVVGTLEEDGRPDFAPKHMVTPLSWENHFGFVCTPRHATYRNAIREGCFTVSFPRPTQVVLASLAAAPRCDDDTKHSLATLPTLPARSVRGALLEDAYLHLECELDRVVDDFGPNSLICGRIVTALLAAEAQRDADRDDQDVIAASPLLAYLNPGHFASIEESRSFPFHQGFSR